MAPSVHLSPNSILAALIIIAVVCSCNESSKEVRTIDPALTEMIERHNAVVDWQTVLTNRSKKWTGTKIYSIDLERAFVDTNQAKMLFFIEVEDIESNDSGYTVRLKPFNTYSDMPAWMVMHCGDSVKDCLLTSNEYSLDGHAVIAQVTGFSRISAPADVSVSVEIYREGRESWDIDGNERANRFALHGVIVECLFLENAWDQWFAIDQDSL